MAQQRPHRRWQANAEDPGSYHPILGTLRHPRAHGRAHGRAMPRRPAGMRLSGTAPAASFRFCLLTILCRTHAHAYTPKSCVRVLLLSFSLSLFCGQPASIPACCLLSVPALLRPPCAVAAHARSFNLIRDSVGSGGRGRGGISVSAGARCFEKLRCRKLRCR